VKVLRALIKRHTHTPKFSIGRRGEEDHTENEKEKKLKIKTKNKK
jgi:hypothetical protein